VTYISALKGAGTMNSIKAVLFDLDNTLLNRQTAFLQVAQAFYNSYGAVRGKHTQEEVVSRLVSWHAFGTVPRHAFERA
jgi:beta-phosphoglucomutase-like phosphatase (HAD superfamily)